MTWVVSSGNGVCHSGLSEPLAIVVFSVRHKMEAFRRNLGVCWKQGGQMSLWKNRPKRSPARTWSKLVHVFCEKNEAQKCFRLLLQYLTNLTKVLLCRRNFDQSVVDAIYIWSQLHICDCRQFSVTKLAFFLKSNVMIPFLQMLTEFYTRKRRFLPNFFGEKHFFKS
jgi:hypothetical protein